MDADIQAAEGEHKAASRRRAVGGALAAQACAFLNAVTAVTSASIAGHGVDVPAFQSLLNYCLLGLVHGTRWWLRARATGSTTAVWPPKLASPLQNYLLLAAVDVEANYLIVRAYQYTNITSVTLLDSASIPAAMVLSRFLLNVSYNRVHLASAAVVLVGFCVLVAADTLCTARGGSAPSPAPLMGDLLAVTAACLYATSNVLQERLLIAAPAVEVLAAFGILGAGIAGLQCAVLESHALATSVTWDASFVGPLFGFALAMFCIYTIAPIALSNAGSAGFNLHMLSSDLWSAAARAVLFGGFGGACGGIGFAAALVTVAAGLGLFSAAPAPKRGMLALDSGEQLTEVSGEEVSHELNVET